MKRRRVKVDGEGQPVGTTYALRRRTSRTVDELIGISKGVLADGVLNKQEADLIVQWLDVNRECEDTWPVNILTCRIEKMLEDKVIDKEERKELFPVLTEVSGGGGTRAMVDDFTGEEVEPFDTPPPLVEFKNKNFSFTGMLLYGSRKKCVQEVESRGGTFHKLPIFYDYSDKTKTDYLVVGLLGGLTGSPPVFGRVGNKLRAALELKEEGSPIAIISEEHWVKHL